MDDLITTTEAAKIAGVGVSSIKRWANQSLIQVVRTPGGHRRVVKANLMRFLQDAGAPFRNRSEHRNVDDPTFSGSDLQSEMPPGALGAAWADTLESGDVFEIQAVLLRSRRRLGSWFPVADEACLGLREIGLRWQRGELSVIDEHIASERLNRALTLIAGVFPSSPDDPTCILACAGEESHTLGLSFLQVCLREAGWHPLWIGASTPIEYLCDAASSTDVKMVAISASEASQDKGRLSRFVDRLEESCRQSDTHLVLGGSGAWPPSPSYAQRLNSFVGLGSYLEELR